MLRKILSGTGQERQIKLTSQEVSHLVVIHLLDIDTDIAFWARTWDISILDWSMRVRCTFYWWIVHVAASILRFQWIKFDQAGHNWFQEVWRRSKKFVDVMHSLLCFAKVSSNQKLDPCFHSRNICCRSHRYRDYSSRTSYSTECLWRWLPNLSKLKSLRGRILSCDVWWTLSWELFSRCVSWRLSCYGNQLSHK